jgi:hypothetical protein
MKVKYFDGLNIQTSRLTFLSYSMENEISDFQEEVRETNKASTMALECAAYILRRACELPLNQRKGMIERLKQLISVDEDQ